MCDNAHQMRSSVLSSRAIQVSLDKQPRAPRVRLFFLAISILFVTQLSVRFSLREVMPLIEGRESWRKSYPGIERGA